jgi:hypothetical protein
MLNAAPANLPQMIKLQEILGANRGKICCGIAAYKMLSVRQAGLAQR